MVIRLEAVPYYPVLGRLLGVKAAVLLCCVMSWQQRTAEPLGAEKTAAAIEADTGLTYEEQRTARRILRDAGLLVETERRLEHRMFFRAADALTLAAFIEKATS
jgi:hypothetical protein